MPSHDQLLFQDDIITTENLNTEISLLKINVDDMDFVENKSDYESILSMIKKEL